VPDRASVQGKTGNPLSIIGVMQIQLSFPWKALHPSQDLGRQPATGRVSKLRHLNDSDWHQLNYYRWLNALSGENDWDGWISFFIQATFEQDEHNCEKATGILHLYSVMKQKINETLKSK